MIGTVGALLSKLPNRFGTFPPYFNLLIWYLFLFCVVQYRYHTVPYNVDIVTGIYFLKLI